MYKDNIFQKFYRPLIFLLFVALFIFLGMKVVLPIGDALAWSLLFSFLGYPFFRLLNKYIFRGKSKSAAAICAMLILLLICVVPILCLVTPLATEVKHFAGTVTELFAHVIEQIQSGKEVSLEGLVPEIILKHIPEEYWPRMAETVASAATYLIGILSALSTSLITHTAVLVTNLGLAFFFAFFIIRDAESMIAYIKKLLPLKEHEVKKFFDRTYTALNSVVYGALVAVFLECLCAGIGWWYVGLPNPLLFSIAMFFFGLCPTGTILIWLPASIYLFYTGDKTMAPIFFIWCLATTGSIENFLRPLIISSVGRGEPISPFIVMVGLLGGIFSFGFLGIFAGPIVLVMLFSVLDIYIERKNSLAKSEQGAL